MIDMMVYQRQTIKGILATGVRVTGFSKFYICCQCAGPATSFAPLLEYEVLVDSGKRKSNIAAYKFWAHQGCLAVKAPDPAIMRMYDKLEEEE